MSLISHYDRTTGGSCPVAGAVVTFHAQIGASVAGTAVASTAVHEVVIPIPAGMTFKVTDVVSYQGIVATAAAALRIGTTAGGQEIVADSQLAVAGAAATTVHTVVTGATATSRIFVRVTGGSGGTVAAPVGVSITGYVLAVPTTVTTRGVAEVGR